MFCYAAAFNINCISRELIMWTDISSEHPIFIKKVAALSGNKLSKDIIERLKDIHKDFLKLNHEVKELGKNYMHAGYYGFNELKKQIKDDVESFLEYDKEFINLLENEIIKYSKKDELFFTLLEHITEEQKYMYRLFAGLLKQL